MPRKSLITRKILLVAVFFTFLVAGGWVIIYHSRKAEKPKKVELKVNNNQNQNPKPFSDSKPVSPLPKQNKTDEQEKLENNQIQNNFHNEEENAEQNPPATEKNIPLPISEREKEVPKETPKFEEPKEQNEEPNIPPPPPSQPNEEKPLKIVNGKVQVPRRWLWTTEINDIVCSFLSKKWSKGLKKHRVYISPAGCFIFNPDTKKVDLNNSKRLKWNNFHPDNEIIFIPVNVDSFHHSLLVYKKSDDTFRHYDSLGGCNFSTIKAKTINNDNLIEVSCPHQSDGWGSCGTYPPVITSILLKRFKNNGLASPADWEISQEEFLTERGEIMELVSAN